MSEQEDSPIPVEITADGVCGPAEVRCGRHGWITSRDDCGPQVFQDFHVTIPIAVRATAILGDDLPPQTQEFTFIAYQLVRVTMPVRFGARAECDDRPQQCPCPFEASSPERAELIANVVQQVQVSFSLSFEAEVDVQ